MYEIKKSIRLLRYSPIFCTFVHIIHNNILVVNVTPKTENNTIWIIKFDNWCEEWLTVVVICVAGVLLF